MGVNDVAGRIAELPTSLLVVSGGEPLLQQRGLIGLFDHVHGHEIEVETNGTIRPHQSLVDRVTRFNVSPKLSSAGGSRLARINPDALAVLRATGKATFKFVVSSEGDLDEVDSIVAEHDLVPIYVMPEGTNSAQVLKTARRLSPLVLAKGWNITLRVQVLLYEDARGV